MKVKCLFNTAINLPKDLLIKGSTCNESEEFSLILNKEYIVYAIIINNGYPWYYLSDESYSYFPIWNPSALFEVIDGRLSKYWIFSYTKGINFIKTYPVWAFPEWANDPDFYDKLSDGELQERELFERYKELMDLEFPDASISDVAQIGDNEWLLCSNCLDAWKSSNDRNGMVKCPKCKKVMQNPRYKVNLPYEQSI